MRPRYRGAVPPRHGASALPRLPTTAVLLVVAALAAPARAEPPATPAAGPRYHIAVRPAARASGVEQYLHTPPPSGPLAMTPIVHVEVARQARDAYAAAAGRLFQAASVGASAPSLEIDVGDAGELLDQAGWSAFVEHDVSLRGPDGQEVARWRLRGQSRILGVGATAVPQAFRRAAEQAAQVFEADFETMAGARAWLEAQGVAPAGPAPAVIGAPLPRHVPAEPIVVPPRTPSLLYLEGGGFLLTTSTSRSGGGGLVAGWSGRHVLFQVSWATWPVSFTAKPPEAWVEGQGKISSNAFGLDLGLQRRLGNRWEVHAGAGARVLSGNAQLTYVPLSDPGGEASARQSASGISSSLFVGARLNGLIRQLGYRYRLGVEVRKHFGASLDLGDLGQVQVGDLTVGATVGFEFGLDD